MARRERPDAVVWKGGPALATQSTRPEGVGRANWPTRVRQGLLSWRRRQGNRPLCFSAYRGSTTLLLASKCGSVKAKFWLRAVQPDLTEGIAERLDTVVWRCLRAILGAPSAPDEAQVLATLALSVGGLGLSSALEGHESCPFCQLGRRVEHGEAETPPRG